MSRGIFAVSTIVLVSSWGVFLAWARGKSNERVAKADIKFAIWAVAWGGLSVLAGVIWGH